MRQIIYDKSDDWVAAILNGGGSNGHMVVPREGLKRIPMNAVVVISLDELPKNGGKICTSQSKLQGCRPSWAGEAKIIAILRGACVQKNEIIAAVQGLPP